jgi:hypothetical protein
MTFHSDGNVIIPTDELHHFTEGWRKPTNQSIISYPNDIPMISHSTTVFLMFGGEIPV